MLGDYDDAHGLLEQPIVLSKKAVASSLTGGKIKNNNIIQSERSTDLANLISGWQMGQWSQCSPGVCEKKKKGLRGVHQPGKPEAKFGTL